MQCSCLKSKNRDQSKCSCRPKRIRKYVPSHPCSRCGVTTTNPSYCSQACNNAVRPKTVKELDSWLAGEIGLSTGNGELKAVARQYLLKEAGYACTECGWNKPNPKTGKPILCVDHKDGNHRNNFRSNLVVLCYNCHALTPTFGALNIGTVSPRSVTSRKVWG